MCKGVKEKNGLKKELNNYYKDIQNIVSDADRWEAIGPDGYIRCINYTKKCNRNIDIETLNKKVREHYDDKLSKLYPNYFKTWFGSLIAYVLNEQIKILINQEIKNFD
jgi:hypothetical protein